MYVERTNLDAKGRIVIPKYLRKIMGIEKKGKVKLNFDRSKLEISPVNDGKKNDIDILFGDIKNGLPKVVDIMIDNDLNINNTFTENNAQGIVWHASVTNNNGIDLSDIKKKFSSIKEVKNIN